MEDSVFVRILAAFLDEARGCLLPVYVKVVVDWSKGCSEGHHISERSKPSIWSQKRDHGKDKIFAIWEHNTSHDRYTT